MIYFSNLPEVNEKGAENYQKDVSEKKSILQYPYLVLGVIALFMAGGCEVVPIDAIIVYSRSIGIPMEEARHFAEYTLYAMLIGYITSTICIPRFISQQNALAICALLGLAFTIGSYFSEGFQSVLFLILMGFGAAMLWGTIWGLALQNLGSHTKMGSALLLMSVIGGGIFPVLFGSLIDHNPAWPQTSVLILGPCYAYLLYYALKGHKIKEWKKKSDLGIPSTINA
jgi:fucose permease